MKAFHVGKTYHVGFIRTKRIIVFYLYQTRFCVQDFLGGRPLFLISLGPFGRGSTTLLRGLKIIMVPK